MPQPVVLTTKLFFPPARENLVSRRRLVEKVAQGLQSSLLLISAPAGYGKTTLMSEWRAGEGHDYPATWLSLDGDDNDPASFFAYFIAAITTLKPGFGETTLALLQSSPPLSTQVILTSLINELGAFDETFALILDDYHVITDHPLHEAVTYLLEHLPSQMHLVILTRADPPLPLSRLRGRNQLIEIRLADLRFTVEESTAFLNQIMGLRLSNSQVEALEQRTEGWAAGLQLVALSMQGHIEVQEFVSEFTGSHHYIVDYLVDEVLNNQPESVQEFLLCTSILDRLTAPLCDALTGRSDGQVMLEILEHSNLFLIPLDDEQLWYRYHHLFLEVLRKRLSQKHPDVIIGLHHQASVWYEHNGFLDQSVEHAFAINNYNQVVRLFRQYFYPTLSIKYPFYVRRWVNLLPDSLIRNDPWLCVLNAWALWGQGDLDGVEDYLNSGQQALDHWTSSGLILGGNREYDDLLSEISVFRGLVSFTKGNLQQAYELTLEALDLAPQSEYTIRGIVYLNLHLIYREWGEIDKAIEACKKAIPMTKAGGTFGPIIDTLDDLGLMYKAQGQLNRAAQVYRENIEFAQKEWPKNTPRCSIFYVHQAEIYYEWNKLDEAEQLANQALIMSEPLFRWVSIYARILLARLEKIKMNLTKAHQLLEEAETLLSQNKGPLFERELEFYLARVNVDLGRPYEDSRLIQNISFDTGNYLGYEKLYTAIHLAHMLLVLNKEDDLLSLLSSIEPAIARQRYVSWHIQSLVLQAMVWQKRKENGRALVSLEKALSLAEQERFVRVFLDEGDPMTMLLQQASIKGIHPDYVRRLLNSGKRSVAVQALIEPLSERELEVLRLVAVGKSNQQIADTLFITGGTVKKHLNNIFGKLSVQSRTQCVARARELNIL